MALIANIFSSVGRGAIVEYCAKHRFPVVSFLSFLLIFFFLFRGGEKKKESLRKILSDDGEASFLFFFDESPDSGSTVFRINFSFDLGRLVDNRDLICSLYIYTYIDRPWQQLVASLHQLS